MPPWQDQLASAVRPLDERLARRSVLNARAALQRLEAQRQVDYRIQPVHANQYEPRPDQGAARRWRTEL